MNSVSAKLKRTIVTALFGSIACGMVINTIPAIAQPMMPPSESMRSCAECHLQWIETFNQPRAVLLIDRPEEPVEALAETCLSCHDGSTVDSRRKVWLEHGHKTGVEPPPDMTIPENLPLKDGNIACRTCHTAHGVQAGTETIANIVLMRVPNEKSQMCQMCHTQQIQQPEHGSHPITGMSEPIPAALIKAGARAQPGSKEVHCQVCHIPHGSREEHLLVMGSEENQLCLTCHEEQRPGMWREKGPGLHPDRPVIHKPEQLEAIDNMGTKLGLENRLICLSCHRIHNGKSRRFLLAMELKESRFCIQCHPGQTDLFETVHDVSKVSGDVPNLLGFTVEQAGPCSACHMFHQLAVKPQPGTIDPSGMCINCHSDTGIAGQTGDRKGNITNSHPLNIPVAHMAADEKLPLFSYHSRQGEVIACQTCHDPHQDRHGDFLRDKAGNLCRQCHADIAEKLPGSSHDISVTAHAGNMMDAKRGNKCHSCHKTHTWDKDKSLWTFNLAENQTYSDAVCIGCHKNIDWADTESSSQLKHVIHPRTVSQSYSSDMPVCHEVNDNQMICKTCHDPHGCAESEALLRGCDPTSPAQTCYNCHIETQSLEFSMHSRELIAQKIAPDNQICGPCHAVHATETSSKEMLWSMVLAPAQTDDQLTSERRCLGCHGPDGPAKQPRNIIKHPEPLLMKGVTTQWSKSVLVDDRVIDRITCLVCHLPHGSQDESLVESGMANAEIMTTGQREATKPMLRPDVARQFCAQCHGLDALRYHLYYHRPDKR